MALNLLPKGHGRRRAVDKVAELRDENRRLLTITHRAGDDIALLQQELAEARALQAEAEELVVQQQADIDDLTAERDQLAEEVAALKHRFSAQLAAEANAARVTVPPMVRDTSDPTDQATAPIDVRPLWDAHGIRPVTDPGHV